MRAVTMLAFAVYVAMAAGIGVAALVGYLRDSASSDASCELVDKM